MGDLYLEIQPVLSSFLHPQKMTNAIFSSFIEKIAEGDVKILALRQQYKNDKTINGDFLCNSEGEIFVTDTNYAIPLFELKTHFVKSKSISVPIPESDNKTIPLSDEDIQKLEQNLEFKTSMHGIKNELLSCNYTNETSLSLEPRRIYF